MHFTTTLVRRKACSAIPLLAMFAACGGSPGLPPFEPSPGEGSGGPPPSTSPNNIVIGGTIDGYEGSGLVLFNTMTGERLDVAGGATSFAFSRRASSQEHFDLLVIGSPSPPHQACRVRQPFGLAGEYGAGNNVYCSSEVSEVAHVGGTIVGLTGSGLELMLSNEDTVEPGPGVTEFEFPTSLFRGHRYTVGVSRQPVAPAQTCVIRHGQGRVPDDGDATTVLVECMDNVTSPLSGTYGFETGAGQHGYFTFFPDGTYSFVVRMDDAACGSNDGNGVEYGVYRWDSASGEFSIRSAVVDTNGVCGVADLSGPVPTLLAGQLNESGTLLHLVAGNVTIALSPVESISSTGMIAGSYLHGTGAFAGAASWSYVPRVSGAFTVFNAADGTYVSVETQDAVNDDVRAGAEWGCATRPVTPGVLASIEAYCLAGDPRFLDLNGNGGLSGSMLWSEVNTMLSDGASMLYLQTHHRLNGHMESFWAHYGIE